MDAHARDCDVLLANGEVARLRVVEPSDRTALISLYQQVSERSKYLRFFSAHPKLSAEELTWFTDNDHLDREAVAAWHGDRMLGIAGWSRDPGGRSAEVAFLVADAEHGKGLGTLLLEVLAAAAIDRGIDRFTADVLPSNEAMLTVFADAGFDVERHLESGVVELEIPLHGLGRLVERMADREHQAEAASIRPLFTPTSLVVIGSERHPDDASTRLVEDLVAGGWTLPLWFVGRHAPMGNLATELPSLSRCPTPPDLAITAVGPSELPDAARRCAAAGIPALVAVGGDEPCPPGTLRLLRSIARESGMRILGPSSAGIGNAAARLWPLPVAEPQRRGHLAVLTRSAGLGLRLLQLADSQRLPVASFASAGEEADVALHELLHHWIDDPQVHVVVAEVGDLTDIEAFAAVARRFCRQKPIVVTRTDTHPAGPLTAAGVVEAASTTEQLDVATLLLTGRLPAGPRVAVVTDSRGVGLAARQACLHAGLELVDLCDRPALADRAAHADQGSGALRLPPSTDPVRVAAIAERVLAEPDVDGLVLAWGPRASESAEAVRWQRELAAVADRTPKPIIAIGEPTTWPVRSALATIPAVDRAAAALGRTTDYAAWLRSRSLSPTPLIDVGPAAQREAASVALRQAMAGSAQARWVDVDAGDLLAASYGIERSASERADGPDQAAAVAEQLGYPVGVWPAVDPAGPSAPQGRRGLFDATQVRRAVRELQATMRPGDREVIVRHLPTGRDVALTVVHDGGGASLRSRVGPGSDLAHDSVFPLPLTEGDASTIVDDLDRHRGRSWPEAAAAAHHLRDLVTRLTVVVDHHREVRTLVLDPVTITPFGAVAVGFAALVDRPADEHPDVPHLQREGARRSA